MFSIVGWQIVYHRRVNNFSTVLSFTCSYLFLFLNTINHHIWSCSSFIKAIVIKVWCTIVNLADEIKPNKEVWLVEQLRFQLDSIRQNDNHMRQMSIFFCLTSTQPKQNRIARWETSIRQHFDFQWLRVPWLHNKFTYTVYNQRSSCRLDMVKVLTCAATLVTYWHGWTILSCVSRNIVLQVKNRDHTYTRQRDLMWDHSSQNRKYMQCINSLVCNESWRKSTQHKVLGY